jgi:predicted anti-sigma-YlaC factor YlaD
MVPPELDPKCQAARVWISAAIDGEATETERAALRTHIADCAACREWAALAESLVLRVRTAEPALPSRQLVLPPPAARVRRRRRMPVRAVAAVTLAAAAIAGGVFAGTLGAGTPEQQHTPPQRVIVAIADASPADTPPAGPPVVRAARPENR